MKLIKRLEYLQKLNSVKGTPDIKVITGIRRSGKSKLMESFIENVLIKEKDSNIIHINFNDDENEKYLDYHVLLDYVKNKYKNNKSNYLLIDEIQMCQGFEKAINSLHNSEKFDIYITGSNAFLLSSDLATLFTGRTFEIKVFPFSFKEYVNYYEKKDIYKAYNEYLVEGGMSGSYNYKEDNNKKEYINSIFDTLILRDIIQKYNLKNEFLLSRITDFCIDNISNIISINKMTEYLNANKEKVDHKTVSNYVKYLINAFALYKINGYDIKGKKYFQSNCKYYLCDHSFRMARLGTKNEDYGRVLENIVAIELLRRNYEIYVGKLYQKEIDFVVQKNNEKIYIQVANSIEDEKTRQRELAPLLSINDAYPKMIITRTGYPEYDIEGVKIVDVADWLLK